MKLPEAGADFSSFRDVRQCCVCCFESRVGDVTAKETRKNSGCSRSRSRENVIFTKED